MPSSSTLVLWYIHRAQPTTRRQLGEQTGLGPARISSLVGKFVAQGLVREDASPLGKPGRPADSLSVNPDAGRAVGLDIGEQHSRAVLTDLGGRVLHSAVHPARVVADRTVIVQSILDLVEAVCRQAALPPEKLSSLGVTVQGIVDSEAGTVLGWPSNPTWDSAWTAWDLRAELHQRLGSLAIIVDDSVRAMGVTAHRFGAARLMRDFLYMFLGNGIGLAVFVGGELYRGSWGIAGEVGHITLEPEGPWCSCGNRGCLETLASTGAVLRQVRERLEISNVYSVLRAAHEQDRLTLAAVIRAAVEGDKLASRVLYETADYVGKALAIAINLFGPELVVLGGPLSEVDGLMTEAVQRQVQMHGLQHLSRRVRILADDQGEQGGARGAALLSLDALFTREDTARLAVQRT